MNKYITHVVFVVMLLFYILSSIFFASTAQSQGKCAPRASIIEMLKNKFNERLKIILIVNEKYIIELFTSENSWTLILSNNKNESCILYEGETLILNYQIDRSIGNYNE